MKNKKLFWIFALSSIVYFLQGAGGLPGQALFVYMKKVLGLTPSTIMYLGSLTGLAWLVKPLIGATIDKLNLKRKTWIILGLTGDIIIAALLGLQALPLVLLVTFLFLGNWNTAFRDVAVDGIMCVEGKKYNVTGKIQSVQWISITVAALLIGVSGGFIAQYISYRLGYLLLIPLFIVAIILANKYQEEDKQKLCKIEFSRYKELVKDKRFVFAAIFLFLYCFSPSFGTPLSFIQRDQFHWSEIFIGTLGTIIAGLEIIGAILYYKFSQRINIKKWLIGSVILGTIITMAYLYYTPISAIIYSVAFAIVGMFIHLVVMDWMARNTIKGLESTSFALLCSVHNLAGTLSSLSGAALLPIVGLKPLIIISSITTLLCLLFIKKVGFDNAEKQEC